MRLVCLSLVAAGMVGVVAAGGAQGPAPPQSQAPTSTGLLMGQVVDGSTGRPISDAIVSISAGGGLRGAAPGSLSVATAPARGSGPLAPSRVLVDAQGRFLFRDLPPGPISLSASKAGYFGGASGQQSPRGQGRPIELVEAERMGGVTLRLWKYGIVSGTIFDDTGAPITGVNVQLFKRTAVSGRWQFSNNGPSSSTDDRGVYRMGSVTPGDYMVGVRSDRVDGERLIMSLVMADEASAMKMLPKIIERGQESMLIDASVRMYPDTYYPGTMTTSQATVVTIESGAERANVDFRVKAVPARTVAGTVTGPGLDRANPSVSLRLRSADSNSRDNDLNAPNASMDQTGRYVFSAVPAGQYVLEAVSRPRNGTPSAGGRAGGTGTLVVVPAGLPRAPEAPTLCATIPVTVGDKNISDLDVTLVPGGRVTGRVDFDGSNRPTEEQLNQIFVTLEPVDGPNNGSIQRGRVEADGTFRTASVQPGRYVLRVGTISAPTFVSAPGAGGSGAPPVPGPAQLWRPRSATINGLDGLDQPLELATADITSVLVTFTDKPAVMLSGAVRDGKGDGDPQAVVLVFPTDNRLWNDFAGASRRIKTARASRYGVYSVAGLPAGEYFVVAGTDDQFVDMQAPGALESYTRLATRVVLVDGQAKILDLKSGGR